MKMSNRNVIYVEAPLRVDLDYYHSQGYVSVFLAGGISGCSDWQRDMAQFLTSRYWGHKLLIINPRRATYQVGLNDGDEEEQITWEHDMLHAVDLIFFYFAPETVQPIVLFEFGYWLAKQPRKVCYVCHKDYPRLNDVWFQFKNIAKRDAHIHGDLYADDRESNVGHVLYELSLSIITGSIDDAFLKKAEDQCYEQ